MAYWARSGQAVAVNPLRSEEFPCAVHVRSRLAVCALVALLAASLPAATAGAATAKPVVVAITVVKGKVQGGAKRPTVKKGQVVKLVVRTDAGSEIHLHGYEIEKVPVRGKPTVIQFAAKIQGRFEVELHEPDVLLAEISVR